jgi:hypothetical protein
MDPITVNVLSIRQRLQTQVIQQRIEAPTLTRQSWLGAGSVSSYGGLFLPRVSMGFRLGGTQLHGLL